MRRASSGFLGLVSMAAACGSDVCVQEPCALPTAVTINVSSAGSGASPTGVFVTVNGGGEASCAQGSPVANCLVFGGAGHYDLQIGATGFQTATRAVDVSQQGRCGCAVNTVTLNVQLSPQA